MSINLTVAGVSYSVPSSAADTSWAAAQVAWEQAVSLAASNGTWTNLVPQNAWVNGAEVAQYRVNSQGDVDLRGLIESGVSGTVALILPSAAWPKHTLAFNTANSGGTARVTVSTSGNVTITDLTGSSSTFTQLDGIRFSIL